MYYIAWIILIVISLWITIVGFLWAFRTGQFSDQRRARYLPLVGEFPLPNMKNPSKLSIEVYALLIIFGIGVITMVSAVILILSH
jgi:cbb3-type cytochrome oxidase maturation protein